MNSTSDISEINVPESIATTKIVDTVGNNENNNNTKLSSNTFTETTDKTTINSEAMSPSIPLTGLEAPPPSTEGRFKTTDVTGTKKIKFEEFNLKKELLYGIYEKGFAECSPIQEVSIP